VRIEDFTDITYAIEDPGIAVITINRPDRMNSFRGRTVDELITALRRRGRATKSRP
jgi:naphthoate synthase